MKIEMLMPQMGESITEATISKWVKNVGDIVGKDEIILEISTDKVDSEIPTPAAGKIIEIKANAGDTVPVKSLIAVIDTAAAGQQPEVSAKPAEVKKEEKKDDKVVTPLAKSVAEKHGVSISEVKSLDGSGQGGRVVRDDVTKYVENKQAPAANTTQTSKPIEVKDAKKTSYNPAEVQVVPMDNMRKAIAEHMVRSKHTSPHVYSVQEVDMSAVSKWRAKYKDICKQKEGFSLSFTPFFLEATVRALLEYPHVNSSIEGNSILLKKNVNLGCAVSIGNGLIVPVIKQAEEKNLIGLARSLNSLADKARKKSLAPSDVTGGTFTVTNPGIFGTIIGTPIINQPQAAILCLGAIEKRPVVVDDMIAIRERCYLTLSYDHRIIDGSLSGQFLAFIRKYLENWDLDRTLY